MNDASDQDRAALVAVLDEALAAETRTEAPPEGEQRDWLFSTSEPSGPAERAVITQTGLDDRGKMLRFWRAGEPPAIGNCETFSCEW